MQELGTTAPPETMAAANDSDPVAETHRFHFTGSGKEYFRIWIVNLFLTVATLGIYSAWAKVRRLQYFDRNTQLAGAAFNFDGDPVAILRGRILAVVLLGAYQYAFGFSLAVGLAVVAGLLLALPFAMRAALRFRLRNTRYRGLRFSFTGSTAASYAAYLPPVLMFLLPASLLAMDPSGRYVGLVFLMYLAWPLMHGAVKRYQHKNLMFGSLAASFDVPKRRFYSPYLKVIGLGIVCFLGLSLLAFLIVAALFSTGHEPSRQFTSFIPLLLGVATVYLGFLLAGPYVQVRIANLAWSATTFRGVSVSSHLKARAYLKLQFMNVLLTILSLGLYRPFAVVRAYRYRLEHTTVTTLAGFEAAVASIARSPVSAGGDGVADFLGVDLSW